LLIINCKIADSNPRLSTAKGTQRHDGAGTSAPRPDAQVVEQTEDENSKKRKREALDEADPKLQEYLEVMGHPVKKPRDGEVIGTDNHADPGPAVFPAVFEAGESDDEYEDIPSLNPNGPAQGASARVETVATSVPDGESPTPATKDVPAREVPQVSADATDDDWLRSRTNRLLDLVDPDDPGFAARAASSVVATTTPQTSESKEPKHTGTTADVDGQDEQNQSASVATEDAEDVTKQVEKTRRLFLRNLSYTVTEDDIREHFSKFGALEEVSIFLQVFSTQKLALRDEPLDRDSLCHWHMMRPWAQYFSRCFEILTKGPITILILQRCHWTLANSVIGECAVG